MSKKYYTYSFEKLEVWKLGRELRKSIYTLTNDFPKEEMFGLTSQIRRSVGSICTNLAEGSGRASDNEKAYYTNISYSSALETIDHTITSFDLEYISDSIYVELRQSLDEILNKLNALYKHQINRKKNLKNMDL